MRKCGDPTRITLVMPLGPLALTWALDYSPEMHAEDSVFRKDKAFFDQHPTRLWAIRRSLVPEYDEVGDAIDYFGRILFPPDLWVHVMKHPVLGHRVIPVWRGSLPYKTTDDGFVIAQSDRDIGCMLGLMKEAMGVNQQEMAEWHIKRKEAIVLWNAKHGGETGQVN